MKMPGASIRTDPPCPRRLFARVRPTRWSVLGGFVVIHTALLVVFFSPLFQEYISDPLFLSTRGLITHTLVTSLIELGVLVGGVVLFIGRLRPRDLGLRRADLPNALVVIYLLWGLVQLTTALIGQSHAGVLRLNPALDGGAPTYSLGRLLAAVFGSALVEEVTYRGFFLPQLYLLTASWWTDPRRRLAFALALSQLYFGLNHLPAGLYLGLPLPELLLYVVQMVLGGCLFAAVYLRTDNLLLAVGIHAFINNPAAAFVVSIDPSLLMLVFAVVLLLLWPWLARGLGKVFTLRPAARRV